MKIIVNEKEYTYEKGITLLEISKDFKENFKYEIIVANVNGKLQELNEKVNFDSEIKFYDILSHIGCKVYERGLSFLTIKAFKELFNINIKITHSIDKGIYCEVLDGQIDNIALESAKEKIHEYANNRIPFVKGSYVKDEIMKYFESIGRKDKSDALKYVIRSSVVLYKFVDMYDYFYGEMPIDSSYIKYFDLQWISETGFVLLHPSIYYDGKLKEYKHPELVFNSFRDFSSWAKNQGIQTLSNLNNMISSFNIEDLIYMSESHQNMQLFDIAKDIKSKKNVKIVLIAGPSSSGKTTTSKKLSVYLRSLGLKPIPISIDDYFLEREETPKDEFGNFDFESVNAINVNMFNDHLVKILNNEEVLIPTFNFIEGKKEYKKTLKLEENGILIIEGLHALNDFLTQSIDKSNKYKIYISPLTSLNIDNSNRIGITDVRLLRRMVRDNMTRGYNASKTLGHWRSVRRGEEKYVFTYQYDNDAVFNTSLLYELGVLRTYAEPLLFSVLQDDPNYDEAVRLINLIRNVLPISDSKIPSDSILREFIGDSYFR